MMFNKADSEPASTQCYLYALHRVPVSLPSDCACLSQPVGLCPCLSAPFRDCLSGDFGGCLSVATGNIVTESEIRL
jgi:hypothetical protein